MAGRGKSEKKDHILLLYRIKDKTLREKVGKLMG